MGPNGVDIPSRNSKAVNEQSNNGTSYGIPTELETKMLNLLFLSSQCIKLDL